MHADQSDERLNGKEACKEVRLWGWIPGAVPEGGTPAFPLPGVPVARRAVPRTHALLIPVVRVYLPLQVKLYILPD